MKKYYVKGYGVNRKAVVDPSLMLATEFLTAVGEKAVTTKGAVAILKALETIGLTACHQESYANGIMFFVNKEEANKIIDEKNSKTQKITKTNISALSDIDRLYINNKLDYLKSNIEELDLKIMHISKFLINAVFVITNEFEIKICDRCGQRLNEKELCDECK